MSYWKFDWTYGVLKWLKAHKLGQLIMHCYGSVCLTKKGSLFAETTRCTTFVKTLVAEFWITEESFMTIYCIIKTEIFSPQRDADIKPVRLPNSPKTKIHRCRQDCTFTRAKFVYIFICLWVAHIHIYILQPVRF